MHQRLAADLVGGAVRRWSTPSAMTTTRSATRSATSMSCSISSSVTSVSSDSSSSTSRSRSPRDSPDAGSSSIIRSGSGHDGHADLELALLHRATGRRPRWLRSSPSHTASAAARPGEPSRVPRTLRRIERCRPLPIRRREVQVVLDGQACEQAGLLIRPRHPEAGRRLEGADVQSTPLIATEPDRRPDVAGDHVEQRRLAGTVRSEHRQPLAPDDIEIDAAQGEQTTERDDDVTQLTKGACIELESSSPMSSWRCGGLHDGLGAFRHCLGSLRAIPAERRRPRGSRCPTHGRSRASHAGLSRDGGGVSALKVPPKVWSTPGMMATVLRDDLVASRRPAAAPTCR